MYYLMRNNGINVSPQFSVLRTFKTLEQAKSVLQELKEVAKENGWNHTYILTKTL